VRFSCPVQAGAEIQPFRFSTSVPVVPQHRRVDPSTEGAVTQVVDSDSSWQEHLVENRTLHAPPVCSYYERYRSDAHHGWIAQHKRRELLKAFSHWRRT